MRTLFLVVCLVFGLMFSCFAQQNGNLALDSFEVVVSGGPEGTVDFGAGNGSNVTVEAATDIAHGGKQALKVTYDAVSGGYIFVARGFDLDAKNTGWLVEPKEIRWRDYQGVAFYCYGSNSGTKFAFDLCDDSNELWRFIFEDNFTGWKKIECPFSGFQVRTDWQADDAFKNDKLDFPVKSYQFEPLPVAAGTIYFDDVELFK
ncbi:MAG: carbohydrate binding domain-containing protein [Candidatus Omnitrophica bacterium]|nr:carbohydrate binding domain-containing protein [Candidatus Omnitrophota bacterium]MDD5513031.1 carbohydrate binding domain-containing protein [Candidatus Omnitrophota bacterium]